MNLRTSTDKLVLTASIAMGWIWLTAPTCGGDLGPPQVSVQGCSIFYDTNFPTGGTLNFNKPAHCPITIGGGEPVPYAATADLPAGSVFYNDYQNQVITWNGYTGGFVTSPEWSQGNGRYFVSITADYWAGTGGFDSNNAGWDDIRNGFFSAQGAGGWVYATSRITYKYGFTSVSLFTPGSVDPGQSYSVSATTDDPQFTTPVTWSWYVDGSLVGTTSDPEFSVSAGQPSTQQSLEVVATDVNGHSHSGMATVWVGAGCGTQLIC